ncbi:hypothetical protein [Micromonospora arborensis]
MQQIEAMGRRALAIHQVIRGGRIRDAQPPGGVGGRFWFWSGLLTRR